MDRRSFLDNVLKEKEIFKDKPWIIMGDFNSPLAYNQKMGGSEDISDSFESLRDFVSNAKMIDISLLGYKFTCLTEDLAKASSNLGWIGFFAPLSGFLYSLSTPW